MNLCLSDTSEKNKGEKYVAETHNALQSAAVPHQQTAKAAAAA